MTVNSFDQLFESLSAMVDNEASELEMRRVLKSMDDNPEMLERWRRYHLIGSVMRKEHGISSTNPSSLVSSISNTLSREADASTGERESTRSGASGTLRDVLNKTAIAASFAASLVLGFNYLGTVDEGTGENTLASNSLNSSQVEEPMSVVTHAPIGFELPAPEARTVSMTSSGSATMLGAESRAASPIYLDDITDYETQEMLNYLLIQHAERASAHGSLGIMPFARVHKMRTESAAQ